MGLLSRTEQRIVALEAEDGIGDGFKLIDVFGGRPTNTGVRVDEAKAQQFSAVYAAINAISSTVSMLPLKLFRRREDGGKEEVRGDPRFRMLHSRPNPNMKAVNFREALQGHILTHGNAYAEIVPGGRGMPAELWPLAPDRTELKNPLGDDPFYVTRVNGQKRELPFSRVLHIAGLGFNGVAGKGIITLARESIALGLATEEFGARFFGQGAAPVGFLELPSAMTEQAAQNFRENFQEKQGGLGRAWRIGVLEEGISWKEVGVPPEDAQFLQTRKHQVREIARWFNIPPHKIGDLEDATFSNISEQNIEYLQDTIQPWLTRWEQALDHALLSSRDRQNGLFFEHNVDALLRSDSKSRAEMFRTLFNIGVFSINDIREKENMNPVEGGDQRFVPVNMLPLDSASQLPMQQRAKMIQAASGEEPEPALLEAPTEERSVEGRLRLRDSFSDLLLSGAREMVDREADDLQALMDQFLDLRDPERFVRALSAYYQGEDPTLPVGDFEFPSFLNVASDAMGDVLRTYVLAVAGEAASEVGEEDPNLEGFEDKYVEVFGVRQAARSRRQLNKIVSEEPEPEPAIEQRIDEWQEGSDSGRPRAERIAQEEQNRVANAAAKAAWIGAGVVALRWRSVGDSCPFCRRLDGTTVGIDNNFIGEGENFDAEGADSPLVPSSNIGHPPAHPGCDCLILASGA